jgi:hypothetical protein
MLRTLTAAGAVAALAASPAAAAVGATRSAGLF